jgi:hypothetical protein
LTGSYSGELLPDLDELLLAQAIAAEPQTVGIMNDPVEDGVGEGRIPIVVV